MYLLKAIVLSSLLFVYLVFSAEDLKNPRFCQKILRLDCNMDPAYMLLSCKHGKKFETVLYNIDAAFVQPIDNMIVHFEIYYQNKGRKSMLANKTIDICEALRGRSYDLFGLVVTGFLAASGKTPSQCPMSQHNFSVHDYAMDDHKFPPVFFNGVVSFRVKLYMKDKNGKLINVGHAAQDLELKIKKKNVKCNN